MSDEMVSGWRVASYTGGQGNCVEVGTSAATVAVRDTKDLSVVSAYAAAEKEARKKSRPSTAGIGNRLRTRFMESSLC